MCGKRSFAHIKELCYGLVLREGFICALHGEVIQIRLTTCAVPNCGWMRGKPVTRITRLLYYADVHLLSKDAIPLDAH